MRTIHAQPADAVLRRPSSPTASSDVVALVRRHLPAFVERMSERGGQLRIVVLDELGDKRAGFAVEVIRRLYEREAGQKDSTPEQRLAARLEHSLPLLAAFDHWIRRARGEAGQHRKAGRSRALREGAARVHPALVCEIDNGRVARAIREPKIGRKNLLSTGRGALGR